MPSFRRRRDFKTFASLAFLAGAAIALGWSGFRSEPAAPSLPILRGSQAEVQGMRIAVEMADPVQARSIFGFDVRDVGLLPVRLAIDNQSQGVVRLVPQQTFAIDDGQGLAWPLLTADQAYERIAASGFLERIPGHPDNRAFPGEAAATITGFAAGLLRVEANGRLAPAEAPSSAGGTGPPLRSSSREATRPEDLIRDDLAERTLRAHPLSRGEMALGYLFFPGKNEVQAIKTLRLALDVDGRTRIVGIPLDSAPEQGPSHADGPGPGQPRFTAR